MNYLHDEDGNVMTYRDGKPIPDLSPGYGVNYANPDQTAFVRALVNGKPVSQLPWQNDEYAQGYIDQRKEYGDTAEFVIVHPKSGVLS